MKKALQLIAALALIVSVSSCSKEETISTNGDRTPLKFRLAVGKTTRATQSWDQEVDAMQDRVITVYVKDYAGNAAFVYTSANAQISVFYLVNATDGASSKTYTSYTEASSGGTEAELYMPGNGSYVYFVAFSDSNEGNLNNIDYDFSATRGEPGTSKVTIDEFENDPTNELLCAFTDSLNNENTTVSLGFSRMASQLVFLVDNNKDTGVTEQISINNFTVKVTESANWEGAAAPSAATTSTFSSYSSTLAEYGPSNVEYTAANATTVGGAPTAEFARLFVLPIDGLNAAAASLGMMISVNYTIYQNGNERFTGDKEIYFKDLPSIANWEAGKRYRYTFRPTAFVGIGGAMAWSFTISGNAWVDGNEEADNIEPYTHTPA